MRPASSSTTTRNCGTSPSRHTATPTGTTTRPNALAGDATRVAHVPTLRSPFFAASPLCPCSRGQHTLLIMLSSDHRLATSACSTTPIPLLLSRLPSSRRAGPCRSASGSNCIGCGGPSPSGGDYRRPKAAVNSTSVVHRVVSDRDCCQSCRHCCSVAKLFRTTSGVTRSMRAR